MHVLSWSDGVACAVGMRQAVMAPEPETVLVAEDDDELRERIAADLRSQGLRVVEVEDGLELEDYLTDSFAPGARVARPDLVVSEARMPGVSGLTVLRHLREGASALPFIVLSPEGDADSFEEAETLGAEYVVEKPFAVEDLRLVVLDTEVASR